VKEEREGDEEVSVGEVIEDGFVNCDILTSPVFIADAFVRPYVSLRLSHLNLAVISSRKSRWFNAQLNGTVVTLELA